MIKSSFFALVVFVSFASHSLVAATPPQLRLNQTTTTEVVKVSVKRSALSRLSDSISSAGTSVGNFVKRHPKKMIALAVVVAVTAAAIVAYKNCEENNKCRDCVA